MDCVGYRWVVWGLSLGFRVRVRVPYAKQVCEEEDDIRAGRGGDGTAKGEEVGGVCES